MLKVTGVWLDYGKLQKSNRYRITENKTPFISWAAACDGKNVFQEAYRVRVSWSGGLLWDTEWVECTDNGVRYDGEILPANSRITVTVTLKDNRGCCSEDYETWFFRSGLQDIPMKWIAPERDMGDAAVYFRKEFSCHKKVVGATIYACGLGYHKLYLNGAALDTSEMDPAFSDYSKRCHVAMIPEVEHLLEKSNCLAIAVGQGWRRVGGAPRYLWNEPSFSGPIQLTAAIVLNYEDGTKDVITTDESWQCADGPIVYSHLFDGEVFDARRNRKGWELPGFAAASFQNVVQIAPAANTLQTMVLEPIIQIASYSPKTIIPVSDDYCVVDFGQNMAGVCAMRIPKGLENGQQIRILYAEELEEDGTPSLSTLRRAKNTDTYIAAGDERDAEVWQPSFTYHGFRYACIYGLGLIDADSITALSLCTDIEKDSFFVSGSSLLNAIHKCIVQTEKSNIHSFLTDCPQRDERLGWMNDATVRYELTPYGFDVGRLFPKVLEDVADSQLEDGSIGCTAPFVLGRRPADPVCSSFLIAAQQAMLHTGNCELIKKYYDRFAMWEQKLHSLAVDGILEYSLYGDWAAPIYACQGGEESVDAVRSLYTPGPFMSTGFYYYNAVLLRDFAIMLDKQEDAAYYAGLAEHIKSAMLNKWWDPVNSQICTGSQGCQSFALWLGIIPEQYRQAAATRIHEDLIERDYKITTGNICTRYLIDVLTEYGYVDDAWRLMTREEYPSIGYMLQNEATTVWERFELKKSNAMNSHNHPMYGSVGYWFYRHIAGIRPIKAGFAEFEVKPYFPSDLLSANAKIDTPRGDIVVRWVRRFGKVVLQVTVPFSCKAKIYFGGNSYCVGSGFHRFEENESTILNNDGGHNK